MASGSLLIRFVVWGGVHYAPNVETDQIKVLDEITHILDKAEILENTTFIWGSEFNLFFDINVDTDGGLPKLMSENDPYDADAETNAETSQDISG